MDIKINVCINNMNKYIKYGKENYFIICLVYQEDEFLNLYMFNKID